MNSNVFQLATERKKKDQFNDTLEALKIYVSTKFSEDIAHLDPLFQKLRKPIIKGPIVEKCGSDEKIKRRVSFSDCGKSHNSKRNEVKNISTYAEETTN